MSASRKKKERQLAEEPKITSRAQEEQEKAARRKRNTIVYSIIAVVVVILAAILLIWDSGVIQRNTTVATIDGEKIAPSQVAYYYYNNDIIQLAQTYSQYGITGFPFSLTESPKDQTITADANMELGLDESYVGKTYHEYFMDCAMADLRQEYALRAAAKEAGFTLSAEGKESVEAEMEYLDDIRGQYLAYYGANLTRTAYLQMTYGNTMTASKFRTCLENAQLADEFYAANFETLADYSEAELDAYYQGHKDDLDTITYYWRQFDGTPETTKDEDGKTVEPTEEETKAALAAAKAEAEKALAEIRYNPDVVKDNEDYTEASGVLTPGSFYYDWLADSERQPGDVTMMDGTTGTAYFIVVFGERYRDETPTVDVRHILIEASHEDDPATTDVNESTEAPTDEDFAAAEKKAQDILAQWKAGEATETSFAALAEEHSVDSGSNTNGGLYENVAPGRMIETFNDWIFDPARKSGDTGMVKNTQSATQGWHIIYFVGQDEPVWVSTARSELWLAELEETIEIVRTDKLDSLIG